MAKNIVICCDGTGNEFGEEKSNVEKLYMTRAIGTMGARSALTGIGKWWTRVIGLAFCYGISDNIADAYQFSTPHRTHHSVLSAIAVFDS